MVGIRRLTGATPTQFSSLLGLVIAAWLGTGAIVSGGTQLTILAGQALLGGAIATLPAAESARRSGSPRLTYALAFAVTALIVATLVSRIVLGTSLAVAAVDSSLYFIPTLAAVGVYQVGHRASNVGLADAFPGMASGKTIRNIGVGTATIAVLLGGTLIGSALLYGIAQGAMGVDGTYMSETEPAAGSPPESSPGAEETTVQTNTETPTETPTPTEALPDELALRSVALANHSTWFDAGYNDFETPDGSTYHPEDSPSVYFEVEGVGYEKTGDNQYRVDYEYSVTIRDRSDGDSNTTTRSVEEVLTRSELQRLWHGESFYIYYVFSERSTYPYEFEIVLEDAISGEQVSKTVEFEYAPEN
jgi:hypothetical protein